MVRLLNYGSRKFKMLKLELETPLKVYFMQRE